MRLYAGVDIGNSTTEVCIAGLDDQQNVRFLASASTETTGIKGTPDNVRGISVALSQALADRGKEIKELSGIKLNEASPVVGGVALETITETVVTAASMIGHNPGTPAGAGSGVGKLLSINNLSDYRQPDPCLVYVGFEHTYTDVARIVNEHAERVPIEGLILAKDEAVLVNNRLNRSIPVVDDFAPVDRLPEGRLAAIEVAPPGETIRLLSNPYGIAGLLELTPSETSRVQSIAKSLIGHASGVVIKQPFDGAVKPSLPPGEIIFTHGSLCTVVPVDGGSDKIMDALAAFPQDEGLDIGGQPGTQTGQLFRRVRSTLADLTGADENAIRITDMLAVDTLASVAIGGALSGETVPEKAVGIAAMVRSDKQVMERVASVLQTNLGVPVHVAGVEAVMAACGALTTPGTRLPLAVLDLGGGSTDAALLDETGKVVSAHLAGAGELATLLINSELGLNDRYIAEQIKRYPAAKAESFFHIRLESGHVRFFDEPLPPRLFGRVVLLTPSGLTPVDYDVTFERLVQTRREVKQKVFITNAMRALMKIAPGQELRNIPNVVLVGGSSEDFEIPEMLTRHLSQYRVVCGRANVRASEGARNAVATGLVLNL